MVAELNATGIEVLSMDRDAAVPAPSDTVNTNGWLRPRLIGYRPVLLVSPIGKGQWKNIYWKRNNANRSSEKNVTFIYS